MNKRLNDQQSYELMKEIFADFNIGYEENVPENEIGFFVLKNGTEERLPDNFLKGFNRERDKTDENHPLSSSLDEPIV